MQILTRNRIHKEKRRKKGRGEFNHAIQSEGAKVFESVSTIVEIF